MVIADLKEQLALASATLKNVHQDHTVAFGKLQANHAEELQCIREANSVLEQAKKEHEDLVTSLRGEHEEILRKHLIQEVKLSNPISPEPSTDLPSLGRQLTGSQS